MDDFSSRALISLNFSSFSSSCANACVVFSPLIASSTNAVCSPRVLVCSTKNLWVCEVTNFATNRDAGDAITTTNPIFQLVISMNATVPKIVITPVKNCVKPIKSPSEN